MELNIIADVAGEFSALKRLAEIMPRAQFLGVGDLVDRGPQSREVVQWFMDNGDSLMGNHEDMMLDFLDGPTRYSSDCWQWNGGEFTLRSYGPDGPGEPGEIPASHIKWLETRKTYFETDDLIVTHAPIDPLLTLEKFREAASSDRVKRPYDLRHESILWHRGIPKKREKFQVFGHNSQWGLSWMIDDDGPQTVKSWGAHGPKKPNDAWGVCLDASQSRVLTGMHWPSCEIFQVPYG